MNYLRDYQERICQAVLDELQHNASTLFVSPTGTGKTQIALEIIDRWPDKDCQVLCLAHRQELVYQPFNRWNQKTGDTANMEMADFRRSGTGLSRVTFASKDSLHPDRLRRSFPDPKAVGLIWVDEAHHLCAHSKSYTHILDYFSANPNLRIFGCTATPDRTDELALGQMFQTVAAEYPLLDPEGGPSAIADGWLVPIEQELIRIEGLSYDSVANRGGDFIDSDLERTLIASRSVEQIVLGTRKICDETTLIFNAGIEQAVRSTIILDAENPGSARAIASRIPNEYAEHQLITLSSNAPMRHKLLRDWSRGAFRHLSNVGVFTEGMDEPRIAYVVMGRPTKSRAFYAQALGRGTRVLPGVIEGTNGQENQQPWRMETKEERLAAIAASSKPRLVVLDFVGASRHPLIHAVDILGGRYDDNIIAAAKRRIGAGNRDVREALSKAVHEIEEEVKRRRQVQAKGEVHRQGVTAWDVLGITPSREPGWHKGRKPTVKQVAALHRFGLKEHETRKLSFWESSRLLDKLIGRCKGKFCTYKQARLLQGYGYDTDELSFGEASLRITELSRTWKKRRVPSRA